MMRYIKYSLIIIGLVWTSNSYAQYIFASPDADPVTMDGTMGNPYDLQTALSKLDPGETLWLRGGDYTETGTYITNGAHGTPGHPITISSYPGEWARLDGNVICTNIVGADDENETENEDEEEPNPGNVSCKSVLNVNKDYYIFKNFEITMISDDDSNTIEDNFSRYRGNYTSTVANPSNIPEQYPLINRGGINHTNGINCKFINLIIRNLGGNGMGSWRSTGGAEIYGCLIYNNGDQAMKNNEQPGSYPVSGSGIYMQNQTELWKNVENNIFFNNFKVATKLWSASKIAPHEDFLKNLNFRNNVVLNTGSPLHRYVGKECFIAAGASEIEGHGVVHDVNVERNFMYHNLDAGYNVVKNDYSVAVEVLQLGTELSDKNMVYNRVNNVKVFDNYLIGRKQGLRFVRVTNLEFQRNVVRSNYVFSLNNVSNLNHNGFSWSNPGVINNHDFWIFGDNRYFSDTDADTFRLGKVGAVGQSGRRTLDEVRGIQSLPIGPGEDTHPIALNFENEDSADQNYGDFISEMPSIVDNNNIYYDQYNMNVISMTQNKYRPNVFKIVVYEPSGNHVKVNLEHYGIPSGLSYTIRDAENYFIPLDDLGNPGNIYLEDDIVLPMNLPDIDAPNGHYPAKDDWNLEPRKSDPQIGVFIVEFDASACEIQYVLQEIVEYEDEEYVAYDNITTGENEYLYYKVIPEAKVTHTAGTNIVLKPGTHIYPRVDAAHPYLAKIEPCTSASGIAYTGETYPDPETRQSMTQTKDVEKIKYDIKVAPNPTTNAIAVSSDEPMTYLRLSNTLGRTFVEQHVNASAAKQVKLNLSSIPSGLYFLQVTLANGETVTKQVIKK